MDKIRKILRNPATDILFMLGLIVSCVIIINITDLVSKMTIEESDTKAYKYTSQIIITGTVGIEQTEYLTEYLDKIDKGNVYLTKSVHIDNQKDGRMAYVLMEDNEPLLFNFKEGSYDKQSEHENAIIIGESLEEYVKMENGTRYLELDNEQYNVVGILNNDMSAGIDTSIYIFWDTLTYEIKEQWKLQSFARDEIYFESNVSNIPFFEQLSEEALAYDIELEILSDTAKNNDYRNDWYKGINKALLSFAMCFSMLTCFSVSYLWLLSRKQELAIRVAHGYSSIQLFNLLFKDTMKLIVPAFVVSIILQHIYMAVLNIELVTRLLIFRVSIIFCCILLIVLINTLYLMKQMRTFKAIMINEEK